MISFNVYIVYVVCMDDTQPQLEIMVGIIVLIILFLFLHAT